LSTKDSLSTDGSCDSWSPYVLNDIPQATLLLQPAWAYRVLRNLPMTCVTKTLELQ